MGSAEASRQLARKTKEAPVPLPSQPTRYVPANPPRPPNALIMPIAGPALALANVRPQADTPGSG